LTFAHSEALTASISLHFFITAERGRQSRDFFETPFRTTLESLNRVSIFSIMNQIDSSTPPAQGECSFCKRMVEHAIVPIQEKYVHWAKVYNVHLEGNPPIAHFAPRGERTWKMNGTFPVFSLNLIN
jgi:hypothetical protein